MFDMGVDQFGKHLAGFNVIDCQVRDRNSLYLLAREDYTKWPKSKWDSESQPPPDEPHIEKRLLPIFFDDDTEERYSKTMLRGFGPSKIGLARKPKEQCVLMSSLGQVYAIGSGEAGIEDELKSYKFENGVSRGGIRKLRTIDGWMYGCEGNRGVIKRLGKSQWQHWHDEIPALPKAASAFDDIDGFSESDIYCVAPKGDVWHYDGKAWSQIEFPSNIDLETVCCAGDGFVYISGEGGTTFKGRGQQWQRLFKREMSLPFKDMVWYEDRVWATSDYGVWQIHQDELLSPELPEGINAYSGNLSVGDGVLMLAGYGGAGFLRDGQWTKIFSAGTLAREWKRRQADG